MHSVAMIPAPSVLASSRREETGYWVAGLGFSFVLFFALAHIESVGTEQHLTEIEDMPVVSLPFETPPPPPKLAEPVSAQESVAPLAGIDVGPSDSPIKIAVVPPEIEALIPPVTAPRAVVAIGQFHSEFKPQVDVTVGVERVYQQTEVDQPPRAIVRVSPVVPDELFGTASALRVSLLLLIDVNGRAESIRIAESSGKPQFDEIVLQTVKDEWAFSPAIRRGKKVRCLALQGFRVVLSGGSPFTTE